MSKPIASLTADWLVTSLNSSFSFVMTAFLTKLLSLNSWKRNAPQKLIHWQVSSLNGPLALCDRSGGREEGVYFGGLGGLYLGDSLNIHVRVKHCTEMTVKTPTMNPIRRTNISK